jgi:hypothetical protein
VGDLAVAGLEHQEIGQDERAGRGAGAGHLLLDDDRVRVGGLVDRDRPVALAAERTGLPERGDEADDRVPALHPGRGAGPGERELVDGIGRVDPAHLAGGLSDGRRPHAVQGLERAGGGG